MSNLRYEYKDMNTISQ